MKKVIALIAALVIVVFYVQSVFGQMGGPRGVQWIPSTLPTCRFEPEPGWCLSQSDPRGCTKNSACIPLPYGER